MGTVDRYVYIPNEHQQFMLTPISVRIGSSTSWGDHLIDCEQREVTDLALLFAGEVPPELSEASAATLGEYTLRYNALALNLRNEFAEKVRVTPFLNGSPVLEEGWYLELPHARRDGPDWSGVTLRFKWLVSEDRPLFYKEDASGGFGWITLQVSQPQRAGELFDMVQQTHEWVEDLVREHSESTPEGVYPHWARIQVNPLLATELLGPYVHAYDKTIIYGYGDYAKAWEPAGEEEATKKAETH